MQAFYELGEALLYSGSWDEGIAALESSLRELGDGEPSGELALRVTTLWANVAAYDRRTAAQVAERLDELRAAADRGGAAGRGLLLWLAAHTALRGGDADQVASLLQRGLDGGRYLADEGSESASLSQGLCALVFVDRLDEAALQVEAMLADARRRGSVLGFTAGAALHAFVLARRGDLVAAEADLRSALELAQENALLFALPVTLWYGAEAIVERSELDDVAALVRLLEPPPGIAETVFGAWLLEMRGRLRADRRQRRSGGRRGPAPLRGHAGRARPAQPGRVRLRVGARAGPGGLRSRGGDRAGAGGAGAARALALPRGIGVALRTAGAIEGGEEGLAMLNEAVELLAGSPARLDLARALVELGAALRRANRRAAARPPLRAGLDLARACGATRLEERARAELVSAGAKPRRAALTGAESLTPSERRVATMAADGLSNPEIAQALFVSVNTIETHLKHAYSKLSIHSRSQLRGALADAQVAPARSAAAADHVAAGRGTTRRRPRRRPAAPARARRRHRAGAGRTDTRTALASRTRPRSPAPTATRARARSRRCAWAPPAAHRAATRHPPAHAARTPRTRARAPERHAAAASTARGSAPRSSRPAPTRPAPTTTAASPPRCGGGPATAASRGSARCSSSRDRCALNQRKARVRPLLCVGCRRNRF